MTWAAEYKKSSLNVSQIQLTAVASCTLLVTVYKYWRYKFIQLSCTSSTMEKHFPVARVITFFKTQCTSQPVKQEVVCWCFFMLWLGSKKCQEKKKKIVLILQFYGSAKQSCWDAPLICKKFDDWLLVICIKQRYQIWQNILIDRLGFWETVIDNLNCFVVF